jgi:integrase
MEELSKVIERVDEQFIKMKKNKLIKSIQTTDNYFEAFCSFVNFLADNTYLLDRVNDQHLSFDNLINCVDRDIAILYLNELAITGKSKKWQDMSRHSINIWLAYTLNLIITGKSKAYKNKKKNLRKITPRFIKIMPKEVTPCTPTQHLTRTYTDLQIELICQHVNARNRFSIRLCQKVGLRVHELLTLKPVELQKTKFKKLTGKKLLAQQLKFSSPDDFNILNGKIYTVIGKGGLIREVLIPNDLAEELEKKRLKKTRKVRDRRAYHYPIYDVAGGNNLSSCFTRASQRALGWSTGIHSLRHDYAKSRLKTLFNMFNDFELARLITSQELGHFRPQITNTYLT